MNEELSSLTSSIIGVDYKQIFQRSTAPLAVLEAKSGNFKFLAVNDAYLSATHRKGEVITGRGLFEVFVQNPDDKSANSVTQLRASFEKAVRTKEPDTIDHFQYDVQLPKDLGGGYVVKYWSPTNIPLFDDKGEVVAVLLRAIETTDLIIAQQAAESEKQARELITKDATELYISLVQRGKDLLEAKKELKESQEAQLAEKIKAEFLATISHEMRTPLNAIIGFSQLLDENLDNLTEDQKGYVKAIGTAGNHLLGLINDLLDLSKLNARKLTLNEEDFNIIEVIRDVYALFAQRFSEKNILFNLSISPETLPRVIGDPLRIRQVAINLLSNALKYTDEGYVIFAVKVLSHTESMTRFSISVQDTGIGISEADMKRLFTRFEQLDRHKGYGGTGLGLAITKELVKLMHGDVSVESELGKGSKFTVEITLKNSISKEEKKAGRVSSSVSQEHAGLPILVVDDLGVNRQVLSSMLRKFGFETVDEAVDGIEAIEKFQKNPNYCVILMDILMPRMDGVESARIIRTLARGSDVPIIAISANYSCLPTKGGEKLFNETPLKPITIHQLMCLIQANCPIRFGHSHSHDEADFKANLDSSTSPLKVLVVDDQPLIRKLITIELQKHGDFVESAASGCEALQKVRLERFDLVLIDRIMPGMNGIETAKTIMSEISPAPHLVLMSADLTDSDIAEGREIGLQDFIEKPFKWDQLRTIRVRIRRNQSMATDQSRMRSDNGSNSR